MNNNRDNNRGNRDRRDSSDKRDFGDRDRRDFGDRDRRGFGDKREFRDNVRNDSTDLDNIIIGRNPVLEALKSEREIDIIYIAGEVKGTLAVIAAKAREAGLPVKTVDERKLDLMSGGHSHQGVAATVAQTVYLELDELLAQHEGKTEPPLYIACDGIEDPHNLGAIIRSAEAAGADGLIIPKRRNVSVNATVYKTSAGAAAVLPVARVSNLAAAIDTLKKNGVWVYGADMGGKSVYETDLRGACCIIVGAEGAGLSPLIAKKSDALISLPMHGQINSLNASVAAGILLFEVRRQRKN
jgi:23S rRNA (guanosine2251-2'-O)-methyltransferase